MKLEDPFYIENIVQKAIDQRKKSFEGSEAEFQKKIDEKLPEILEPLLKETANTIFKYSIDSKSDIKKQERKVHRKIKKNYGLGITMFEGFIEINSKIGFIFYHKYYNLFNNQEDHLKLDTLIGLHVRACQIAAEIKTLVSNGFADGAHARWRTLHELCITFLFLYDGDHELMEMYNDYEIIESWKKAKEYQECYETLEWDAIPKNELDDLEEQRQFLITKYGKDFSKSYGWTMNILPNGRRNIREIEKHVGKEYLRAMYTWTGDNVHSGVSGVLKRLALRDDEQDHFLTGSTDYGFLDPVQFTSYSLSEMSYVLLEMEDSLLNKVFNLLLRFFQEELVKEFNKQQEKNA